MIDDATLTAFVDGELSPAEAAVVEAAARGDPAVAAAIDRHRRLTNQLRGAFGALLEAPLPESLAATVRKPAQIVDLAAARAARQKPSRAPDRRLWGRIAATLAVGVGAGALISQWRPVSSPRNATGSPVAEQAGRLVAAGGLKTTLDRQLASATDASAPTRVVLTFRDHRGEVCRSFAGADVSGVACRDGGAWKIEGLFQGQVGGGTYRVASAGDARAMSIVEDLIDGTPFDAGREKAARDGGWIPNQPLKRP